MTLRLRAWEDFFRTLHKQSHNKWFQDFYQRFLGYWYSILACWFHINLFKNGACKIRNKLQLFNNITEAINYWKIYPWTNISLNMSSFFKYLWQVKFLFHAKNLKIKKSDQKMIQKMVVKNSVVNNIFYWTVFISSWNLNKKGLVPTHFFRAVMTT